VRVKEARTEHHPECVGQAVPKGSGCDVDVEKSHLVPERALFLAEILQLVPGSEPEGKSDSDRLAG